MSSTSFHFRNQCQRSSEGEETIFNLAVRTCEAINRSCTAGDRADCAGTLTFSAGRANGSILETAGLFRRVLLLAGCGGTDPYWHCYFSAIPPRAMSSPARRREDGQLCMRPEPVHLGPSDQPRSGLAADDVRLRLTCLAALPTKNERMRR